MKKTKDRMRKEWTPDCITQLVGSYDDINEEAKIRLCAAINADLTHERKIRKQAEREWKRISNFLALETK